MQIAKNYIPQVAVHIEHALSRMPVHSPKPTAYMRQEIVRNVEDLLTREEQKICEMATD